MALGLGWSAPHAPADTPTTYIRNRPRMGRARRALGAGVLDEVQIPFLPSWGS